ncbi:ferritin-like domain-containing protein [Cytophaga sp. FL35]|uniref:YciE/YciF ferroxidase family protein n=1 Tax=Cytophaga sp. FL35 TaxID=1904456 RepID=UPI001653B2A5|nr:ferritin-like domain-containing protein [Cytophaga sp. FL35]MBC6999864.1 ferritin-like domain-containing protein [Cytophaga sp. FL35]
MKNLEQLFIHQLKDLFSAESQLLDALPKMAKKATDGKLKKAFEDHLEETKVQKKRIEEICKEFNVSPSGEKCKAMEGLIKEAEHFMEEVQDENVMDAGLIAEAQRVEHYEISGYGTAVRYAKELGHKDVAKKLQETLDEEYAADNKLDKLAETRLNKAALS